MTTKYSPILWWPPKIIQKIFIPQKILIFLKTPKNIEIQNFEPQKNDPSLRMYENIRVPPPPRMGLHGWLAPLLIICNKSSISRAGAKF